MEKINRYILIAILLFFLALIAPLIIIPMEKVLPYPYIIEEVVKVFFILLILRLPGRSFQIKLAIFIAFLLAFSENFFYLSNFIGSEISGLFFQRFILTSFLHTATALIILIPAQKDRRLILLALPLAIMVHYFYNQLAVVIFK